MQTGISHLIKTYEKFPGIVADLRVCIEDIDMQLKPHRHLLAQVPVDIKALEKPVIPEDPPLPSTLDEFD